MKIASRLPLRRYFASTAPPSSSTPFPSPKYQRCFSTSSPHISSTRKFSSSGSIQEDACVVHLPHRLDLQMGGSLPSLEVSYCDYGDKDKPVVYIMPSMSHSSFVKTIPGKGTGWWDGIVGSGPEYGINLNSFRVICASPLGAPYGTTNPTSIMPTSSSSSPSPSSSCSSSSSSSSSHPASSRYRAQFPQITPADQARVHEMLMTHLGIKQCHAVVGSSMGGMQSLEFAAQFPDRVKRVASLAATGRTSPSTVALRSVQRSIVKTDPEYKDGLYEIGEGPINGLGIARKVGTICYRSREEFDDRFQWEVDVLDKDSQSNLNSSESASKQLISEKPRPGRTHLEFEVERYLRHNALKFQDKYDANCYLLLSMCMDLMDLGRGYSSYEEGVRRIQGPEVMLLPSATDALIPASEMAEIATVLGSAGVPVYFEELQSIKGHDAFLLEQEKINPRLAAFLSLNTASGVDKARAFLRGLE